VYLHEDRELPGIPSSGRNNPLHGRSERKAAGCRDSIESKALLKRAGFNADWTVDRELEMWSHRVPPRRGSDLREAPRFPAVVLRNEGCQRNATGYAHIYLPVQWRHAQQDYMNLIRSLRAENSISFSSRPSLVSSFLASATHLAVIRR